MFSIPCVRLSKVFIISVSFSYPVEAKEVRDPLHTVGLLQWFMLIFTITKNTDYILNNRTIFIDDIKNNIISYTKRQLVCPEYNYYSYYDIYEKLITKYKMDPKIFNDKEILKYMEDNYIYIYNKNGSVFQKNKDYVNIVNMYKTKHSQLSTELSKDTDTYFKDLITEFSKKTVSDEYLSDKDISAINKIKTNKKSS